MRLVSLLVLLLLAACSSNPETRPWLTYRIDVRQGNLVTQEMVSQLKVGQTRDQVRFILGTPLVADVFHADRWDYVYRFLPGAWTKEAEQRHLIVYFENNRLARLGGDVSANKDQPVEAKPATRVIDVPPADSGNN